MGDGQRRYIHFHTEICYLGTVLHYDLGDNHTVHKRIGVAAKAFDEFRRVLTSRILDDKVKGRLLRQSYSRNFFTPLKPGCSTNICATRSGYSGTDAAGEHFTLRAIKSDTAHQQLDSVPTTGESRLLTTTCDTAGFVGPATWSG